jgi:DNA-binding NarL/FixJ family response regulator
MTFAPIPVEPPDGSIRALIVDAHDASRLGVAVLLQRQPWVARCLLAEDGHEAAALARRHRPEVALLDVSNAGPFVASATAALREAHPGVQIVLTSRCAVRVGAPPRELGAVAFLPPGASGADVVATVRAAVLSLDAPAPLTLGDGAASLTERERQLLVLISTGATNREIARELNLGPDSVKKNASALYRKLGVRNRTEAARRAIQLLAPA